MKSNPLFKSLLSKSIGSLLSAIEIYNKPDFNYREESFAILAVNAWELLLKAYILKLNKFKVNALYATKPYKKKDGSLSPIRRVIEKNRCGNPKTISVIYAISYLSKKNILPKNLKGNLEALIELRDNAIHFASIESITKQVQELGFACVRNYVSIVRRWQLPIDFSRYNLYLMPLAYVDGAKIVDAALTNEAENYVDMVKAQIKDEDKRDTDFSIAISIDIDFKKGHSFDSIGVKYDKEGIAIRLSEEEIDKQFPLTYDDVWKTAQKRYIGFKKNKQFNAIMKEIKSNAKLHFQKTLDSKNPKSPKTDRYSGNIWQELDKHYTRC